MPSYAPLAEPGLNPGNGFSCSLLLLLGYTPSFDDIQSLLWFFCRRCSNSSLETDDEPPCVEEIDYNTDSCSDGEGDFSELDQEIQECLSWEEGEAEDEGETTGQTCSSKALRGLYISSQPASNSTALPLRSTPLGCTVGLRAALRKQGFELQSSKQMGYCLLSPVCQLQPPSQMLLQFCMENWLCVCGISIHIYTKNNLHFVQKAENITLS